MPSRNRASEWRTGIFDTSFLEAEDGQRRPTLESVLRRRHIPGLDAARGAAILLVLSLHFGVFEHGSGSLGVMMFFVLSGYLITRALVAEYASTGNISLRNFYVRRAFRIFPAFYVCWMLETLSIKCHGEQFRWWEPWASFFYLTDYARALAGYKTIKYMSIAWSLAIEEQFYMLWPVALLWMFRRSKPAISFVTVFIGSVWAYRAFLYLSLHVSWGYIYNAFDTRIDALMMGCLLALTTASKRGLQLLEWPIRSAWLGIFPLAALIATLAFDTAIENTPWLSIAAFSLQPPVIALLLIQSVYFGSSKGHFLASPVLRFIAKISYALYLYHALVQSEGAREVWPHSPGMLGLRLVDANGHPRMFVLLIAAILVSVGSYYWVERPAMKLRDRLTLRRRTAPRIHEVVA